MFKNNYIIVVLPCYNEEKTIGSVIDSIPDFVDKIIVIDDGSTDTSKKISESKGSIVISHNKNLGVGVALNTGILKSLSLNADIMVNMDSDGQFNPEDILKLITPIINNKADFVTASRFKDSKLYPKMSKIKFYGNKVMSFLISRIIEQRFYDVSCGFRAYSKEALLKLNLFGEFTYTQETFIDLAFKGISIVEIPILVKGTRKHGKSRIASNLFKYTHNTVKIILQSYRDYQPLKLFFFFSLITLITAVFLGLFLLIHYITSGHFTPHKWAGFLSGFLLIISLFISTIGFILDMFKRMRYNQEKLLYNLKKHILENKNIKNKNL